MRHLIIQNSNFGKSCDQVKLFHHFGHRTLCFCNLEFLSKSNFFRLGKALDKDLRSLIVDTILSEGEDVTTRYFSGNFRDFERGFKVTAVSDQFWNNFGETR